MTSAGPISTITSAIRPRSTLPSTPSPHCMFH